jgi:regulatory protein YycH of two-component signal transduction system YycFG
MARKIVDGSKWYLVSMSWYKKWQLWTYYDHIENEENLAEESDRENPGPIDCSDIVITPKTLFVDPHGTW